MFVSSAATSAARESQFRECLFLCIVKCFAVAVAALLGTALSRSPISGENIAITEMVLAIVSSDKVQWHGHRNVPATSGV